MVFVLEIPATDIILNITTLFSSFSQCRILSCGFLELKRKKLRFKDIKLPLFQACPDQKLSLSRSEAVQFWVIHCTWIQRCLPLLLSISSSSEFFKAIITKHSQPTPITYLSGVYHGVLKNILDFVYLGKNQVEFCQLEAARSLKIKRTSWQLFCWFLLSYIR